MIFEVLCKLGKKIKFTKERYNHIIFRHPEMINEEKLIEATIAQPDFICESEYDDSVTLYYKTKESKYIVVVVKLTNNKGFILTAYIATIVKKGKLLWKK